MFSSDHHVIYELVHLSIVKVGITDRWLIKRLFVSLYVIDK
jgi:hypothetical protein